MVNSLRKEPIDELILSVIDEKVKELSTIPSCNVFGPRIGIYYGVVVEQDHFDNKVQPIETATGLSPITLE